MECSISRLLFFCVRGPTNVYESLEYRSPEQRQSRRGRARGPEPPVSTRLHQGWCGGYRNGAMAQEETIARSDFNHWIAPDIARIAATVDIALAEAGLKDDAIDRVFLTGGTSLVPAVRGLFTSRFGAHLVTGGGEFVSVAEGLALIGRDRRV